MKAYIIVGLAALSLVASLGIAVAIDPPHDPANNVNCNGCHTLHNSLGPSLTKDTNANLCISCHNPSGNAANKPFATADQANIGVSGTSHHWGGVMPNSATDQGANNPYGLRTDSQVVNATMRIQLGKFGTCSNPSYKSKSTCETNLGTWTAQVVCSICHNMHSQVNAPWDPNAPAYGGTGTGSGRRFMRIGNDLNQMCEDCHYYRTAGVYTDLKTYDGSKKSHPVLKNISTDVADPTGFIGAAPVEPNASAQTGAPRYHLNSATDTNATNNIVFDSAGKIRCLSCHGMHYTDSDSSTVDTP